MLCVGVWLWLKVEPQRALFEDTIADGAPAQLAV
jgi:hypothetical protein